MILAVLRYQMKTARQIRFVNVFSAFTFAVHFYLLGAYSGAVLCLIASLRSSVLMRKAVWPYKKYVVLVSLVLCTIVTAFVYQGWIDILPLIGLYTGTLLDAQDKALKARAFGFSSSSSWFFYHFAVMSHGGIVSSIIALSSNLIGFWRHQLYPYLKTKDKKYFEI